MFINDQNEISLSSYSKNEWGKLLAETAYRGFRVNEISQRFKEGYACTFENDHLINLISSKGKERITVDMNDVRKKYDHWTFSLLFHKFRMLFTHSAYAIEFNERITKLAEILTINARTQVFHDRCQDNLGNLAILPSDIHDQIIYALPNFFDEDISKRIEFIKMFWKAPLGDEVICGTIDVKKFASWINQAGKKIFHLNLKNEEIKSLFPFIKYLKLSSKEFIFNCFEVVGTCKNLQFLTISDNKNLTNDHFQQIAKLSNLTHLNLSKCSEINEGLKIISGLKKLSYIFISNCEITLEGFRSIKKMKNLTRLVLNQHDLKENKVLKHIAKHKSLEYLSLGNTQFTKEGLKYLEKCPSLTSLDLGCGSLLLDEDIEAIGRITSLINFGITNSSVTGSGFRHLTQLKNLKNLKLDRCKNITDDSLQYIAQINSLTHLEVKWCEKLTRENFEKLTVAKSWRD